MCSGHAPTFCWGCDVGGRRYKVQKPSAFEPECTNTQVTATFFLLLAACQARIREYRENFGVIVFFSKHTREGRFLRSNLLKNHTQKNATPAAPDP